jgi:signal transduction histidine kinase
MSAGTGVEPRVRLALAYEFIQRMDGELWCDSRPGHRVSFSFRLPAVE